jgi:hypothetical protein
MAIIYKLYYGRSILHELSDYDEDKFDEKSHNVKITKLRDSDLPSAKKHNDIDDELSKSSTKSSKTSTKSRTESKLSTKSCKLVDDKTDD